MQPEWQEIALPRDKMGFCYLKNTMADIKVISGLSKIVDLCTLFIVDAVP